MIVQKKFPAKVACVHCNGGTRCNKAPEGYDLCSYGCTGCGHCAKICPANAIMIVGKKAVIDRKKCVRCFCCQEFCPKGAMKVGRTALSKLLVKGK